MIEVRTMRGGMVGWWWWCVAVVMVGWVTMVGSLDVRQTVDDFIIDQVDPEQIRDFLREVTQVPHLAGTERQYETAQWVADIWSTQGWDKVNIIPYQVLLSYPKNDTPNLVSVLDGGGEAVWTSEGWQEPIYASEEFSDQVLPNFNAFSGTGLIEGDVVYANFGREVDFAKLEELGVEVAGKIVIARYGKIFRGNIVHSAEEGGAIGVILYSDPQQYAPLGQEAVYPDTIYLPPSGVQDGNVFLYDADPLTRLYPAIESAYRIPESEANVPRIPVQPLSYRDAQQILSRLGGAEAPVEWQGGLNLTYHLGGLLEEEEGWRVRMDVHTTNTPATIYNVLAVMEGSEEPDRYVVLGNHRDAWIFGGVDPSSGTASLLEVARVLTQLRDQTGWRPRRSIVLCSWDAEEYGLMGSMEWTEQFGKQLADRAVAYLNVDNAVDGNYSISAKSAPLLYDELFNAAAKVPNPDPLEVSAGRLTVYDTWAFRNPDTDHPGRPRVLSLGSGSDFKGFQHNVGVPSLDIKYTHGPEVSNAPLYHSLYETFAVEDELYDQGFYTHAAITQMWAVMAVDLADAKLLPLDLMEYGSFVVDAHNNLLDQYGDLIATKNITMDYFSAAVNHFNQSTATFADNLPNIDTSRALETRRINDQMMLVERAFIDPQGLPDRPDYNHVIMAPSAHDSYSSSSFSGLTDALAGLESLSPEEQEHRWRQFSQHLAAVTHLMDTAARALTLDLW